MVIFALRKLHIDVEFVKLSVFVTIGFARFLCFIQKLAEQNHQPYFLHLLLFSQPQAVI